MDNQQAGPGKWAVRFLSNRTGQAFSLIGSSVAPSAMVPLSLAAAGPLADSFGIRAWYVTGGLSCVVMGLVARFIPAIVNLEQNYTGRVVGELALVPATAEVVLTDADVL